MTTRRPLFVVALLLLVGAAVFAAGFSLSSRICARPWTRNADDLDWLRLEFRLGEPEMQRIRRLHEGYLPICRARCEQIAARKLELAAMLNATAAPTEAVRGKLTEIGALRADCQAEMLAYFHEVSQAMPADQGQRYLARMRDLTLGLHEQLERSMAPSPAPAHGHH